MIKYEELKKLAESRLEEARILHQAGFYDCAVYLTGYVVELSLKARICRNLNSFDYHDSGSHKQTFALHEFDKLLLMSGLSGAIGMNKKNKRKQKLFDNWSLLTEWDKNLCIGWNPVIRYKPIGTYTEKDSENRLHALEDHCVGFFSWIKTKW